MIARFSVIFSIILVGVAWAKQPNVLILYADDLGFGDLGCYNKKSRIPTPNLDRLASESVRFTDGHSSSGICTPSRFAMLTGRHHWRDFHGIVNAFGGSVFKPERLTLPEMLKEKGYKTAAIGKWHLGWNWDAIRNKEVKAITVQEGRRKKQQLGPEAFDWTKSIPNGPLNHGFDYYFGDTVINFPPYCWIENDKVVKAPDTLMQTGKWKKIKEGGWECRPGPMVTGWDPYENIPTTTKKGVDYIKEAAKAEEPFFLYFAYPAPHAPIIPNDEFDGKSKAGPYGDFVYETDHSIGQLLQALKDSGQAENTIVIFSADNGPEHYAYARDAKFDHWSAHPFRGLKRDAYEGGHHVPFIVKYPGVTMAGTVNDALVSQIDIMATLASVVGYDLPDKNAAEDSHDLLPLLKGQVKSIRTSHIHNTFDHTWAFRESDWVLVTGKSGHHSRVTKEWLKKHDYPKTESKQSRLFNLREDIGQRNDLAAKHPEKVKAMEASLARIREQGYSAPRLRK
ncbi:arylsulfatase [Akkermansiaceae bacterium]|nr:arylsulfatase [Akkermansiaceae bacterium]MDA7901330.1 arylsulfatase [bacterium]MDB4470987.1 arylsulfatase [Akkermansiaceae bacterium]MDB4482238.1 arylsulfatase [Akkermansiaceae bacterium]